MTTARVTPTGTRLQTVRDEDALREPEACSICQVKSWRPMHLGICENCRTPYPARPVLEQLVFHGEIFVVAATTAPVKRPRRAQCSSKLKLRPAQLDLSFDRPRSLARAAKGYSLGTGKLTTKEKADSKALRPYMLRQVPKTRADCVDGPRPCCVARCRHSLLVTVNPDNGSIKLSFPDRLPEELEYTCSLDAADDHRETGMTLEKVGELGGWSLERVRQIEASGIAKMKARLSPDARRVLFGDGKY